MHPEKKASMATAMVPPERQVEMTAVLHLRMDLHMQSTVDRHHLDLVRRLLVLYSSLRLRLLVAAMEKSQQTCRSEFMMVTEVSKVFKFVLLESSPTEFVAINGWWQWWIHAHVVASHISLVIAVTCTCHAWHSQQFSSMKHSYWRVI
eukprot:TRINITY_DN6799_c0_g1_i2.p1 TRINITY_DN6799_c0_g1~~TRINITY_DN6799_c0_g1_i2.p1  ORF type:complete len:148 (-),score=9.11 TRINITY_DN6799_c0_g1_i2:165-608(-)